MVDLGELGRCRLCSSDNNLTDAVFPTNARPNQELIGMIFACTSIRITFERDFPCAVCSSCVRIVKQFYAYRSKCLDHNRNLKRLRGESTSDEDSDGDEDVDPLKGSSKMRKRKKGESGKNNEDKEFYGQIKQEIQTFLDERVKEIERKALDKVNEALRKRKQTSKEADLEELEMTVEFEQSEEPTDYEVLSEAAYADVEHLQQMESGTTRDGYKVEAESIYFPDVDIEDTRVEPSGGAESSAGALEAQLREAQRKIDTLVQLNYELEVKRMRLENGGGGGVVQAHFTVEEGIPITVQELEDINARSSSDSVFVGMLATKLIDVDALKRMSVTGNASPRFAKFKKPDGTPLYPRPEKMDPNVFEFICNKVAERTAIRIGPEDTKTIRKHANECVIRKYLAQKISNLKKSNAIRKGRDDPDSFVVGGEQSSCADTFN